MVELRTSRPEDLSRFYIISMQFVTLFDLFPQIKTLHCRSTLWQTETPCFFTRECQ